MNRPPAIPPARQRGIVSIIAALALLVMVGLALRIGLGMSASSVIDSSIQSDSVEALFLAESGLERATRRFAADAVACDALGETQTLSAGKTFTVSGPAAGFDPGTDFSGDPLPPGRCRVRVTGNIASGSVARMIEAIVQRGGNVYNFPDSSEITPASPPGAVSVWTNYGPASGGYRTTSFCPGAPSLIPAGTNDIAATHILADSADHVVHDASQPAGANAGSFNAYTSDKTNGNAPGGRVAGYRETTLNAPLGAGTIINASFFFRKERGGQPEWMFMAIDLVASDNTIYRLWCHGNSADLPWSPTPTAVSFTVPGGKTINRARLVFDLKNKTSGGGTNDKRWQQIWFDQLNLGGDSSVGRVINWREVIY